MSFPHSSEIDAMLGTQGWIETLIAAGIPESALVNRHGPCPACGGKDRFRFDNKNGRGDFYCSGCGPGYGFDLLMRVRNISFVQAKDLVATLANIDPTAERESIQPKPVTEELPAIPTRHVKTLLRESCSVENCDAALKYLTKRKLWPLPAGHRLRAHPSVEYFQDGSLVWRYPALLASVRNIEGRLVTAHVTYLTAEGAKITDYTPRKILSKLHGHKGCAAKLMPQAEVMGIAEGIETAFSATKLTGIPTWAALNTSLLAKFWIGHDVRKLVIFADNDAAGIEAAQTLADRLDGEVATEMRIPERGDWNDTLAAQS